MSYDTTVHDALDPPLARVSEPKAGRSKDAAFRRRWTGKWRPFAAAGMSICTLFLVTWVVSILTSPKTVDRTDVSEAAVSATLEELVDADDD